MKYILLVIILVLYYLTSLSAGMGQGWTSAHMVLVACLIVGVVAIISWGVADRKGGNHRIWFWMTIGSVIAWLVLGIITSIMSSSNEKETEAEYEVYKQEHCVDVQTKRHAYTLKLCENGTLVGDQAAVSEYIEETN